MNFEDPEGVFLRLIIRSRVNAPRRSVLGVSQRDLGHPAALIKTDVNPDRLSHEPLAAELTNHLIPGVMSIRALLAPLSAHRRRARRA
jgi:hypothetical protein